MMETVSSEFQKTLYRNYFQNKKLAFGYLFDFAAVARVNAGE